MPASQALADDPVEIIYSANSKSQYTVGQKIIYDIDIGNKRKVPIFNYSVQNLLKDLSINLANNLDPSAYNESDVMGHPFSTWQIEVTSVGSNSKSQLGESTVITDDDLNDVVTIAPSEKIHYRVTATATPVSISDLTTKVTVTSRDGKKQTEEEVTITAQPNNTSPTIVKKPTSTEYIFQATHDSTTVKAVENICITKKSESVGDLRVTKSAKQAQIQPGGAVEYEILVENPNDSLFENFAVIDHYPAGFRYIEGSARISQAPAGGELPTNDKPITPEVSNVLTFKPLTLEAFEKLRIRYVLKASIAIGFGNYKNIAYADNEARGKISNDGRASVSVLGDKLFDTTAIIGKVFEDHNGNGYQSDATAKDLRIAAKIDPKNYIAGSTSVLYGKQEKIIPDAKQPAINKGVVIKELAGKSSNRSDAINKAVVYFKTRTDKPFPLTVTSKTGTNIIFDTKGQFEKMSTGNVKKGLSNEDLYVTRNLFKKVNDYLWEIIIENQGFYDDGIPGVRLITSEGVKVDTDAYGRYHIPDRWVLDKKGQNFLIKVDTDSLPSGMGVISENPKVLRLTPNHLSKFNFSVQRHKEKNK